jgi:hypothetical protein
MPFWIKMEGGAPVLVKPSKLDVRHGIAGVNVPWERAATVLAGTGNVRKTSSPVPETDDLNLVVLAF